jgi:hypothetical protein
MQRCLIFLLSLTLANAEHLVVGFLNPDEIHVIANTTVSYDTVAIFNNGHLIIDNASLTSSEGLIVLNNGRVTATNSDVTVSNLVAVADSGHAYLSGNLTFYCDFYTLGNGTLVWDAAEVTIPMTYVGEREYSLRENSTFRIQQTTISMGAGKLGGGISGTAHLSHQNVIYDSDYGISITLAVAEVGKFTASNCMGGVELVIMDSADIDVADSETFIFWHTFPTGSAIDFEFPESYPFFPYHSDIDEYQFANTTPGVSGVDYSIDVTHTNVVFWGIFPREGSNVTLRNSVIAAAGIYFWDDTHSVLNGITNDSTYADAILPFSDRHLRLVNTNLKAWNFYPFDNSRTHVQNSLFGEALTFGNSILYVENSICDGTGGYFGAEDNSTVYYTNSVLTRTGGGRTLLVNSDNATMIMNNSVMDGDIILNDNARLVLMNTYYLELPVLNKSSLWLHADFDAVQFSADSIVVVHGTLETQTGPENTRPISHYQMHYSLADSSGMEFIGEAPFTGNVTDGDLMSWNTSGLARGEYRLWLTPIVTTDTLPALDKLIWLDNFTTLGPGQKKSLGFALQQNYPNPFNPVTTIAFTLPAATEVRFAVFDVAGKVVQRRQLGLLPAGANTFQFAANELSSGVYFYRLSAGKNSRIKKMMVIK